MIRPIVLLFLSIAVSVSPVRGQESAIPKPPSPPAVASVASPDADANLATRVAQLEKEVADLKKSNKELVDIVANHHEMLHDVVADHKSSSGGYLLNLQPIMADPRARHELADSVVHEMTRSTGELQLRNDTETGQSLLVNGLDRYYVAPHTKRTIAVPSGTATTELAGEGVKSWMIGAPNYSQEVVIGTAARANVASDRWQYDPVRGVWWRVLQ